MSGLIDKGIALAIGHTLILLGVATVAHATPSGYLPFPNGTPIHVYQSWGSDLGCSTHCKQPDFYAWDFGAQSGSSEGMSIVSSTSGTVIGHRNDYSGTCTNFNDACAFGNYVFVHNSDGTYIEYLHMKQGSVVVSDGQHLEVGDPIGQIGATGYTGGFAHLHISWLESASGTGNSPSVGNSIPAEYIGVSHPTYGENLTSNNRGGGPLEITTTTLPRGTPGQAYATSVKATGGSGGYRWSLASGALQLGLSLSPTGAISGTPIQAGGRTIGVTVTDSERHTQTASLVLAVGAAHQELFARASNGSIWHDYFIPGPSSWSGWGSLGSAVGAALQSDVAVGYNQSGSEELFARASNGSVWHDYLMPGNAWSGWYSLGAPSSTTLVSNVSVGYNSDGEEELFARASNGSIWHDYFIPGTSSWSGWGSLGGAYGVTLRSDVAVGYNQSGSEELFARASNGGIWHDYFIPGPSSWSGWGSLGGAYGVALRSDVSTAESATP